jgi:hypothetical protein
MVLRGAAGGVGVTVALPFLDCMLNNNGTALAATGQALPVAFGTYFQDLGLNPGRWVPKTTGPKYENNVELKVLDSFRDKINIISGMEYYLDGRALETHTTGPQIATTGTIPQGVATPASFDSLIADTIGKRSRFRSIEVCLSGSQQSRSKRAGTTFNPSEPSPAALYTRIFGPDFKDPNAAEFTPDPVIMVRKSALSYITDQRAAVMSQLGAADKARLDEYFTAIREIENQLAIDLEKPGPMAGCTMPEKFEEAKPSSLIDNVQTNNKLFSRLIAHAVACGQTRVFNVMVGSQGLRKPGASQTWHSWSHEEHTDEKLGYQPEVTFFIEAALTSFVDLLKELDSLKEGAGTVFDRTGIVWLTDHGYARTHSMDNVPVMTAGTAGGRLKTGIHVAAPRDPVTRVGLTMQQIMGVPVSSWGTLSNQTSKTITEILA